MAQAQHEWQPGEHVSWNYGAGQARGQIVEKVTENKKIGSRVFKASPDDPKYLVKSDTSGKEAIKKPETLHKIEEDAGAGAKSEGQANKQEVGVKEKRHQVKARSSSQERKEAEGEEMAKKVQDTGKGSVRASAKAAQTKIKEASAALMEDTGEERDVAKKDRLEVHDDEEGRHGAQGEEEAKEEGVEAEGETNMGNQGEAKDPTYEPAEDKDVAGKTAEDEEEVINTLPAEEEPMKQMEEENKEAVDDAVAGLDTEKS